jgi:hypothetical protein
MLYNLSVTERNGVPFRLVLSPMGPGYETLTVNLPVSMPADARQLAVRLARIAAGAPSSAAFNM